jgi:hypothetical protein
MHSRNVIPIQNVTQKIPRTPKHLLKINGDECEHVKWTEVVVDKTQLWSLLNKAMNLQNSKQKIV